MTPHSIVTFLCHILKYLYTRVVTWCLSEVMLLGCGGGANNHQQTTCSTRLYISAAGDRMTGVLNLSIRAHALGRGDGLICISRIIQDYTLINNTGMRSDQ